MKISIGPLIALADNDHKGRDFGLDRRVAPLMDPQPD